MRYPCHRNIVCAFAAALAFFSAGVLAQAAPRMVRVAVLSGQSNMARGTGPVALTAWPQPWFDNTETTDPDNTVWSGLRLSAEGGVGVHAGVAEALQAAYPDDQIAILKVAQGSTGISFWADEGQPGNRDLMNRITVAKARLDAQLAAGEISGYEFVGFFWMQGEDEINPWNTNSTNPYFERLIRLTSGVRSRAGMPGLPVVLGRTSSAYAPSRIRTNNGNLRVFPVSTDPGTRPLQADSEFINSDVPRGYALYEGYSDSVRTAQAAWTTYDGQAAWVESDDLPLVDYFHFPEGETGKITLGRRMGRALMRLKGLPVADELLLNAGPHRWVHPGTIRLTAAVTSGPASPASVTWSQLVGNQTATIESPGSLSTNVTLTEPGTYAFQVTATDGALTHSKTVNVYVRPAGENLPAYGSSPVFYASAPGAPVTLIPDIVNPDSDTLTYTWNLPFSEPIRRFGLGKGIISLTTAANPTVRFTWPGVHILRLQISDGTTRADGNASGWINVPVFVGTIRLPDF
ncbi:MAG: sialate O-acetylesterase [Terrimicrobiaceae bacterium]